MEREGIPPVPEADLGIGMFFLPPGLAARNRCIQLVEQALERGGVDLLAWREVPVNRGALGQKALATVPHLAQAIVRRPEAMGHVDFERRLYLTFGHAQLRSGGVMVGRTADVRVDPGVEERLMILGGEIRRVVRANRDELFGNRHHARSTCTPRQNAIRPRTCSAAKLHTGTPLASALTM